MSLEDKKSKLTPRHLPGDDAYRIADSMQIGTQQPSKARALAPRIHACFPPTPLRYRRGYPLGRMVAGFFLLIVIRGDNLFITCDNNPMETGMSRRTFEQVDTSTGEVLSGFVAVIQPKRKNGFGTGWVAMAQNAMLAIAKADMGDEAMRVFFVLAANIDFENWIQISQTELADEIGIKKSNFSRAMKRLEAEGIILRGPKVGRSASFRLNPEFGWKGSAKGHKDALKKRMEDRGMRVV